MLSPDVITGLQDLAAQITAPLSQAIIQDICRRVSKTGELTSTAEYQAYRAQALSAGKKEIAAAIQQQTQLSNEYIDAMLSIVADKTADFATDEAMQQLVYGYAAITKHAAKAMLEGGLWVAGPDKKMYTIGEAYEKVIDYAFGQTMTGAMDANTAIHKATQELVKRGVRVIEQSDGRTVGIEYATRRYVCSQMGRLSTAVGELNHDKIGADGWEISAHAAPAEDHAPYQGRQYTDKQFADIQASLPRPFGYWFCTHTLYPVKIGRDKPVHTDAELQQYLDADAEGVTYNGRHYTLREAKDQRASVENAARLQKNKVLAEQALGDKEQLQIEQIKLNRINQEYVRFCHGTGQKTRSERMQVAGFGHSDASKAVWAVKKAAKPLSDISELKAQLYAVTDARISSVQTPFFTKLSYKQNVAAKGYAQKILRSVQSLPLGTEATISFSADGKTVSDLIIGTEKGMRVKVQRLNTQYYALHNHASDGMLSPDDIKELINDSNMVGIGAIGHESSFYTCEKIFGYKQNAAKDYISVLQTMHPNLSNSIEERLSFMDDFIKEANKYGLKFGC